eukprot:gene9964-23826_t
MVGPIVFIVAGTVGLCFFLRTTLRRLPIPPPVTLAASAVCVVAHARRPPLQSVCISYHAAAAGGEWTRLLLSPWYHADLPHLCYCVGSLAWKGTHLERDVGPAAFAALVALSSVLTQAVGAAVAASAEPGTAASALTAGDGCCSGLGGAVMAMKVVAASHPAAGMGCVLRDAVAPAAAVFSAAAAATVVALS